MVTVTLDPFQNIPEELTPAATEKYLGGTDDPVKKKDLFLDLIGDVMFGVPSVTVARLHRGESQRLEKKGTLTQPAVLSVLPTPLHKEIFGKFVPYGLGWHVVLCWFLLEGDSWKRIQVQVVCFGSDPRKHE